MRTNNAVTKLKAGQVPAGFTIRFPSATIVEMMGSLDFDFAMFDSEHGPFTESDIEEMCRACDAVGLTPMARVPNIFPSTILRFLDRGIMGILAPHISNREEADQLARACRYGPEGERSFGTGRGRDYGLGKPPPEYIAEFNCEVTVAIQIETREGVDSIDDLLEVDGIDFFTFGPQDLAQSLGYPGDASHPEVAAAMKSVTDRVHDVGRLERFELPRDQVGIGDGVLHHTQAVMWLQIVAAARTIVVNYEDIVVFRQQSVGQV